MLTAIAWVLLAATIVIAPSRRETFDRLVALGHRERVPLLVRPRVRRPGGHDATWLVIVVLAVGVWLLEGVALAVGFAALAWVVRLVVRDAQRRRRSADEQRDLLLAVRMLVTELEAGASPGDALGAVAGVLPAHRELLSEAARAGAQLLVTSPAPELVAVGHALRVAEESGAPCAEVVRAVGVDLAAAAAQRHAVGVAVAGPRASAAMLAGLPIVGMGLGVAMGAHPLHVLLQSTAGHVLACLGAVLDAAGLAWTYRLVTSAERAP